MAIESILDAQVRLFAEEAMASLPSPPRQSLWRMDEWHLTVLVRADGVWRDAVHDKVAFRITQARFFGGTRPKPIMEGPMAEMRPALAALTLEAPEKGRLVRTPAKPEDPHVYRIHLPVLTAADDPEDLRAIYHEPLAIRLDSALEVAWAKEPTPHLAFRH